MGKILVPVDGSDGALRALAFAVKRAKERAGTSLHVLTVHLPLHVYGEIAIYGGEKRMRAMLALHDTHVLRGAEKRLRRTRIAYSTEALEGEPAEVIAQRAKSLKCDSIIMGTRGMGRIATLVMGSVATKVIHLTSLPVTLVK
ncbi:MAG TPA: universal stress protein [Steroidobacteraceae bacterium]